MHSKEMKKPSPAKSENKTDPKPAEWIVRLFHPGTPLGFHAGDSNLYRYVKNSPAMAVDPSGLWSAFVGPTISEIRKFFLGTLNLTGTENLFADIQEWMNTAVVFSEENQAAALLAYSNSLPIRVLLTNTLFETYRTSLFSILPVFKDARYLRISPVGLSFQTYSTLSATQTAFPPQPTLGLPLVVCQAIRMLASPVFDIRDRAFVELTDLLTSNYATVFPIVGGYNESISRENAETSARINRAIEIAHGRLSSGIITYFGQIQKITFPYFSSQETLALATRMENEPELFGPSNATSLK